jgi:hypothetical protein
MHLITVKTVYDTAPKKVTSFFLRPVGTQPMIFHQDRKSGDFKIVQNQHIYNDKDNNFPSPILEQNKNKKSREKRFRKLSHGTLYKE